MNAKQSNKEEKMEINVKLQNLGAANKNRVTISTEKGTVNLYFSYETLVAVDEIVSKNEWNNTTGKLLNELAPKESRVPHKEVLKKAQEKIKRVLYG